MAVHLEGAPFDPWAQLLSHQQGRPELAGKYGATAVFVGTMRDFNQGEPVRGLWLEHYPEMTRRALEGIAREARERWEVLDLLVVHRYGALAPAEPIVLVAVWAAHRGAAFAASRYLVEELKHRAPFWKKETLDTGDRWVAGNTPAEPGADAE